MTTVLDPPVQESTAGAELVEGARVERLLELARDGRALEGLRVLSVGSSQLAGELQAAGAAVGLAEPDRESEADGKIHQHPGDFPSSSFPAEYDVVVVASGFEDEEDALPRVARACRVANEEVLAFLPQTRRGWFVLGATESEAPSHEPAWIKRLFETCGASVVERHRAPGGYVIRARF